MSLEELPSREAAHPGATAADAVLFVDLDGTLIATDLLHESFLSALRRHPLLPFQCAAWLLRGRARLKKEVAARAQIDPANLPYRTEVLAFLRDERSRGRRIVLATASWHSQAQAVARHVGLFDEVIATTDGVNLKGSAKAARLEAYSSGRPFDYIGNSAADRPVWRKARHGYVAGPRASTFSASGSLQAISPAEQATTDLGVLRALRPHQWTKNLLVFVPMLAAHKLAQPAAVAASALAFAAFCAIASSAYLLNDLLDVESDRAHPAKRSRPIASGRLAIPPALGLVAACIAAGIVAAASLPGEFAAILGLYFGMTVAYSLGLKRVAMLDVIILATLYTVRIIAGGLATAIPVSPWLLAFGMFFFFSLALVKRYAELAGLQGTRAAAGRDYLAADTVIVLSLGAASALVSALVLALYVNGETAARLYSHPQVLWLLCPVLLYWLSRTWLLAARGQMNEDPVIFALRDPASYATVIVGAVIGWAAL